MNMKRLVICAVLIVALSRMMVLEAQTGKIFGVELSDKRGAGRVLNVSFYSNVPAPAVVDKILRQALEIAIAIDPTKEILATVFHGDEVLSRNQGSGSLVYRISDKKIVSLDEFRGQASSVTSTTASNYSLSISERKTATGITPVRRWLSVELIFPNPPSPDAAYAAVAAEVGKLVTRGLDIDVSASSGDPKVKTSWKQIRDKSGIYIGGEYSAATKRLIGNGVNGRLIRQF